MATTNRTNRTIITNNRLSTTTTTTNTNTTTNSNKWNDIPKRLTTICIGVPILWTIWMYTFSRIVFFQGLHIVLIYEWIQIVLHDQKNQHQHQQQQQQQQQRQKGDFDNTNSNNNDDKNGFKTKSTRTRTISILYWILPCMSLVLANITNDQLFVSLLFLYIAISTILFPNHNHNTTTTTTEIRNNNNTNTNILIPLVQCTISITIPLRSWNTIIKNHQYGFIRTISLLLTVWNCDTGSLLIGRLFSSNKSTSINTSTTSNNKVQSSTSSIQILIARIRLWLSTISPNKSLEGIVGGICFGILTYIVLPWIWIFLYKIHVLPIQLSLPTTILEHDQQNQQHDINNYFISFGIYDIIVGIVLSFSAIVGDLVESSYKRQYNVKDSSKLLPGHGGILDRFDSSLVSIVLYNIILQYRHSIILFIQQHIILLISSSPDSDNVSSSNTYFRPY